MLLTLTPDSTFSELSTYSEELRVASAPVVRRSPLSKRTFDFVFALLVVLFVLIWLIPLIACIIKLESKGPVFFKQPRTGKDGQAFDCFKFRSMRQSDDAHTRQASLGDNRITKSGAFLRRTSLDELPQFLNVLRGEMSVVGPRPHMLKHTDDYSKVIDNFMDRHLVRPGITGLAQVSGYRGETKELESMVNRFNADIHYLRNWSFLLDLRIVLRTVTQAFGDNKHVF
jgi:putative colanic acid biosynthesis UDP-glucose lipid carrier transferase